MRSIKDQMTEIRRRRGLYREKKQVRNLSILAAGMGILLMAVMIFAPGVRGAVDFAGTHLGATILGSETGGYVIVALLSFALGILITLITQKYRKIDEELKGSGRHESGK